MKITIHHGKSLTPKELATLRTLTRQGPSEARSVWFQKPRNLIVAIIKHARKIIGWAVACPLRKSQEIDGRPTLDLGAFVTPSFRHRGLARTALAILLAQIPKNAILCYANSHIKLYHPIIHERGLHGVPRYA